MEETKEKGVKVTFTPRVLSLQDFQEHENFIPKIFPQCLATFIATLGSFGLGCALAWTSPALPDLEKRQDFGPLTLTQTSWITSFTVLGALLSGPVSGFLINRFGRRKTMMLMSLSFTIGWLCIGFAQNITMIHCGRFITGLTGGSFLTTIPIFVSEISENKLRGMLGSAMVLMLVSGILFVYTVGAFVSWWQLALISAMSPLVCFLGLIFTPETPRYLLIQGRWNAAAGALRWFRGASNLHQINPELSLLKRSVDSDEKTGSASLLKISSWKNIFDTSALKPLGVILALMIFQQMSGVNAVQSYTVKIFQSASPHIDPNLATIIIGIVQVVFVFLSMMLVDRVGRKILLVLSFGLMALSLGVLGTFFQVRSTSVISEHGSWIPLVAVILFVVSYSFGLGPLPWVLFGEIMSPKAKGLAASVVTSVYWITAFISTKTFEELAALLGWQGYYWHLTVICVLGGVFTIFLVPETKGKSQDEIQAYFTGKKEKVGECEQLNQKSVDIDNNLQGSSKNLAVMV